MEMELTIREKGYAAATKIIEAAGEIAVPQKSYSDSIDQLAALKESLAADIDAAVKREKT